MDPSKQQPAVASTAAQPTATDASAAGAAKGSVTPVSATVHAAHDAAAKAKADAEAARLKADKAKADALAAKAAAEQKAAAAHPVAARVVDGAAAKAKVEGDTKAGADAAAAKAKAEADAKTKADTEAKAKADAEAKAKVDAEAKARAEADAKAKAEAEAKAKTEAAPAAAAPTAAVPAAVAAAPAEEEEPERPRIRREALCQVELAPVTLVTLRLLAHTEPNTLLACIEGRWFRCTDYNGERDFVLELATKVGIDEDFSVARVHYGFRTVELEAFTPEGEHATFQLTEDACQTVRDLKVGRLPADEIPEDELYERKDLTVLRHRMVENLLSMISTLGKMDVGARMAAAAQATAQELAEAEVRSTKLLLQAGYSNDDTPYGSARMRKVGKKVRTHTHSLLC